jgi:hypothetical protein
MVVFIDKTDGKPSDAVNRAGDQLNRPFFLPAI